MIDMSEVEMAAIREAFGTESRVLFCWFHVQQAIQRQFRQKIPTQEGRLEARQDFNKIMYSNTQEEYEENKDRFIRRHQDNRGLIDYLNGQYFRRAELWVRAFRQSFHGAIDTNNFIEAWHKKLKYFFFKNRPNRRIDRLIWTLSHLVEKWYLQESFRVAAGIGRMSRAERERKAREHEALQQVINQPWVDLIQVDDPFVLVPSFTSEGVVWCINIANMAIISCSCPDYLSRHLPCKHMLAVDLLAQIPFFLHSGFQASEGFIYSNINIQEINQVSKCAELA